MHQVKGGVAPLDSKPSHEPSSMLEAPWINVTAALDLHLLCFAKALRLPAIRTDWIALPACPLLAC